MIDTSNTANSSARVIINQRSFDTGNGVKVWNYFVLDSGAEMINAVQMSIGWNKDLASYVTFHGGSGDVTNVNDAAAVSDGFVNIMVGEEPGYTLDDPTTIGVLELECANKANVANLDISVISYIPPRPEPIVLQASSLTGEEVPIEFVPTINKV